LNKISSSALTTPPLPAVTPRRKVHALAALIKAHQSKVKAAKKAVTACDIQLLLSFLVPRDADDSGAKSDYDNSVQAFEGCEKKDEVCSISKYAKANVMEDRLGREIELFVPDKKVPTLSHGGRTRMRRWHNAFREARFLQKIKCDSRCMRAMNAAIDLRLSFVHEHRPPPVFRGVSRMQKLDADGGNVNGALNGYFYEHLYRERSRPALEQKLKDLHTAQRELDACSWTKSCYSKRIRKMEVAARYDFFFFFFFFFCFFFFLGNIFDR
jgi:hypothetical protein